MTLHLVRSGGPIPISPVDKGPAPVAWQTQGICAQTDPDLWFSDEPAERNAARWLCKDYCPVRALCLEAALGQDTRHGIWAGYSVRQLRTLRKARAADLPDAAPLDTPTAA
ncbi:WhiB family transcriptional regulator [Streptomyces sp. BI20]|uniref:WhiB family transcriptional regulator n=1 Tax=Streptomyces sp. BI20 TaxID=3403460 RepID=UPI003C71DD41